MASSLARGTRRERGRAGSTAVYPPCSGAGASSATRVSGSSPASGRPVRTARCGRPVPLGPRSNPDDPSSSPSPRPIPHNRSVPRSPVARPAGPATARRGRPRRRRRWSAALLEAGREESPHLRWHRRAGIGALVEAHKEGTEAAHEVTHLARRPTIALEPRGPVADASGDESARLPAVGLAHELHPVIHRRLHVGERAWVVALLLDLEHDAVGPEEERAAGVVRADCDPPPGERRLVPADRAVVVPCCSVAPRAHGSP